MKTLLAVGLLLVALAAPVFAQDSRSLREQRFHNRMAEIDRQDGLSRERMDAVPRYTPRTCVYRCEDGSYYDSKRSSAQPFLYQPLDGSTPQVGIVAPGGLITTIPLEPRRR